LRLTIFLPTERMRHGALTFPMDKRFAIPVTEIFMG